MDSLECEKEFPNWYLNGLGWLHTCVMADWEIV